MTRGARSGPASVWWRVALLVLLAAYMAAAVLSGLDRSAREHPRLAGWIPHWASMAAASDQAMQAWQAQDGPRALALARDAVGRTPIESRAVSTLGATMLMNRDLAGANRAFRVSAQMGWRDRLAQMYWLEQALQAGEPRLAALRMDALLRQQPEMAASESSIALLEADPRARAEWLARLAERPNWLGPYSQNVAALPMAEAALRAQVLTDLAARGTVVGCLAASPLTERLIDGGMADRARLLWAAQCPEAGTGSLVTDGHFVNAAPDQTLAAFAWQFVGQADAATRLEPAGRGAGRRVVIDSNGVLPSIVLRQLVMVPQGPVLVRWRATDEAGRPSDRIQVALSCDRGSVQPLAAGNVADASGGRGLVVDVDGTCPARWLHIAVAPGSGSVRLEDVAIVRQ